MEGEEERGRKGERGGWKREEGERKMRGKSERKMRREKVEEE